MPWTDRIRNEHALRLTDAAKELLKTARKRQVNTGKTISVGMV